MHRHLTPRARHRAIWFQDLATALSEAEKLLDLLEVDGGYPVEAGRLRVRVQTVRSEIELLNRVMLGEERIVGPAWPGAMVGNG